MKIIIDDIGCDINQIIDGSEEELVSFGLHYWGFTQIVKKVLTAGQFERFIGIDTARTFTLSAKNEKILLLIIEEHKQQLKAKYGT